MNNLLPKYVIFSDLGVYHSYYDDQSLTIKMLEFTGIKEFTMFPVNNNDEYNDCLKWYLNNCYQLETEVK